MKCPKCKYERISQDKECPQCGVNYEKWQQFIDREKEKPKYHVDKDKDEVSFIELVFAIFYLLFIMVLFIYVLTGNEKAADISSPINYDSKEISFSYPGNWKVKEKIKDQYLVGISAESPGAAVLKVFILPKNYPMSLREFSRKASTLLSSRAEETLFSSVSTSSYSTKEKNKSPGRIEGFTESYTARFLGESVHHTRGYYTMRSSNRVVFLFTQVASEDLSKVEPGFNLILNSLVVK